MKKVFYLFYIYCLLFLLEACVKEPLCYEVTEPYFTYEQVILDAPSIVENDTLNMSMRIGSIKNVASTRKPSFFINSAYAKSCQENGMSPKYHIEDIIITSNIAFHDTIDVDQSLTKYFEYDVGYNIAFYPLSEKTRFREFNRHNEYEDFEIRTNLVPQDKSQGYYLTVKIINSNNDTLVAVSPEINWN
ncbi:MAG: hypothetical protein ACI9U0_001946 [Flavobacteriales bacterium]|jgi:hypothetical protein